MGRPWEEVFRPARNPFPNTSRPRQPVIVDGTTNWRERQIERMQAHADLREQEEQLEEQWRIVNENIRRIREELLNLEETRRHIAIFRQGRGQTREQPWTMTYAPEMIDLSEIFNAPPTRLPRQVPVNLGATLQTLDGFVRENIVDVNGVPQQHDIQRPRMVTFRLPSLANQARNQARQEAEDPLAHVNTFRRARSLPPWAIHPNVPDFRFPRVD